MPTLLDAVLPVFGVVVVGYVAVRLRWLGGEAVRGLSLFVFNFALPAMLFRTLALTRLPDRIEWEFLVSFYGAALIVFAIGMAVARRTFGRPLVGQGLAGLTASYSNTVLLGIPIVLAAFGVEATVPLFLVVATQNLVLFPPATALIEAGLGRDRSLRGLLGPTIAALTKNPIVVSLTLGLLFNLLHLRTPGPVDTVVAALGSAAIPTATFALGATLARYRIAGSLGEAGLLICGKMLVQPLLVWLLATLVFDLAPLWTSVAVLMAGLPTGINAYLFAERYDHGVATAATAVVLSTGISIVSLSMLILLLPTA
jgi:predicted permease